MARLVLGEKKMNDPTIIRKSKVEGILSYFPIVTVLKGGLKQSYEGKNLLYSSGPSYSIKG